MISELQGTETALSDYNGSIQQSKMFYFSFRAFQWLVECQRPWNMHLRMEDSIFSSIS